MIGGVWHRDTIAWVMVAAVLPAAAVAVLDQGMAAVLRMVLSLAIIWGWQGVFLVLRAQPMSPIAIVTAVAIAVLAPGDLALWQLLLAVSFGAVLGEQIFGGWGRNVINAAVVTLAFLYFAFPIVEHPGAGSLLALACVPALLMLLITGIVAWQVVLSAAAALLAVTWLLGGDPSLLVWQGSLAFGLVFLICDPVASAATRPGRWLYGALAGGLTALFGWGDVGIDAPQAVVFAALLASLFAPLIDSTVIMTQAASRRRRHGR